ncbi:unnamed protein product [Malus baccata var. baccata]
MSFQKVSCYRRWACTYKAHHPFFVGRCGMLQFTSLRDLIKILSALGHDYALTVLFLGTHMRTSQWVTHPGNVLARTHLTSEFRWNLKPVSSQKVSCYKRWGCTYKAHHLFSVS